jgi:prepilin-type N-terminal cleavage/methylation domain-containing protein/prepilin-type processing-associated H-X9-DG protein
VFPIGSDWRPTTRPARSAFTLVELLVVIAIIGILMALMLPAVQAARETARRMKCTNHLKQIGLAIHQYHNVHQAFPPGTIDEGVPRRQEWGWPVFLLPYLEQRSLYNELDPSRRRLTDVLLSSEMSLVKAPLSVFRCPSDRTPTLLTDTDQRRDLDGEAIVGDSFFGATSNYIGVTGFWEIGVPPEDGVLYANSAVSFAHIRDGASNTFAVGERDFRCGAGIWAGVPSARGRGPKGADYVLGRISLRMNDEPNTGVPSCCQAFSSPHPDGGNFALCDGSVQFVSETIEFNNAGVTDFGPGHAPIARPDLLGAYQRLGIATDGQPVGARF